MNQSALLIASAASMLLAGTIAVSAQHSRHHSAAYGGYHSYALVPVYQAGHGYGYQCRRVWSRYRSEPAAELIQDRDFRESTGLPLC
jgi:hypothetical protein